MWKRPAPMSSPGKPLPNQQNLKLLSVEAEDDIVHTDVKSEGSETFGAKRGRGSGVHCGVECQKYTNF